MSVISSLLLVDALGVELRRDLLADLGAPFLDRLEALAVAAIGLGLAVELVLRLVEIDLEAEGLRHIPRGIAAHLDLISLGVLEIDRPGITVAGRAKALAAGIAHLAKRLLHVGERLDVERHLLHHRCLGMGRAAAHQDDLVVIARVARQEGDAAVLGPVAEHKAENLRIEVDHLRHVANIKPDMAEAWRGFRHGVSLPVECSGSSICAEAISYQIDRSYDIHSL